MIVLRNFRIVDADIDLTGSVIIEDCLIKEIIPGEADFPDNALFDKELERLSYRASVIVDGRNLAAGKDTGGAALPGGLPVLMPAFIDLHAHFRDPGLTQKETLEAACLAASAGGYGTAVCMANTIPVTDTLEKAAAIRARSDSLGLIDLYPVLSLTKNMEGRELSGITDIAPSPPLPLMLSEDGRDVYSDSLFLAAMEEARRLGIPISCHCDAAGPEAEAARQAGKPRPVWARIEENSATARAIALGREKGCRIHIAHVSTREAMEMVRQAKKEQGSAGFTLTCEVTPHHISCTEDDARRMGDESFGRVNPSLRTEDDRQALIAGILDGTADAVATDHAPHTREDKAEGAPGFSGLETGFAACFSELVKKGGQAPADSFSGAQGRGQAPGLPISLKRLSALMSANPASILGLENRGRMGTGLLADLVVVDPGAVWKVDPARFRSKGKNSPFAGRELQGKVLMTIHRGKIVFDGEMPKGTYHV
jgi:dihydroorotase